MSTAETLPELVVAVDTKIHLPEAKILVVVDCQNDFLHPKGTLKCPVNDCVPDDEVKEIFCKETIYVLLNKLIFIRICEDKGFLEKNISNGGIEE